MDLDIEMGDVAEVAQEAEEQQLLQDEDILQPEDFEEPGEVAEVDLKNDDDASKTIVPTKIHIRGLETLHTADIKAYIKAYFGDVDKVEWIDDNSANLVFGSEPTAREAIVALSSIEIADATALGVGESLPAKQVEGKPEISLQVRFSLVSDKKQTRAALRSRYYLLHPEHNPEERRRLQQDSRSRYRNREHDPDYRGSTGRRRRGSDVEVETFEASMYDDTPRPSRDRRSSDPMGRPRFYPVINQGKELIADRATGRGRFGRDRSASPRRDQDKDKDGDAGMDDLATTSRNRSKARSIKDRLSTDNRSKELFPSKPSAGRGGQLDHLEKAIGSARLREEDMPKIVTLPSASNGEDLNIRGIASQRPHGNSSFSIKGAASARELFPDKLGAGNFGKELIDTNRPKRRQRAEDLFS